MRITLIPILLWCWENWFRECMCIYINSEIVRGKVIWKCKFILISIIVFCSHQLTESMFHFASVRVRYFKQKSHNYGTHFCRRSEGAWILPSSAHAVGSLLKLAFLKTAHVVMIPRAEWINQQSPVTIRKHLNRIREENPTIWKKCWCVSSTVRCSDSTALSIVEVFI